MYFLYQLSLINILKSITHIYLFIKQLKIFLKFSNSVYRKCLLGGIVLVL